MTAPLQGITVVEAANYVAGPSASALMALAPLTSDVSRQHDSAYWARTLDANGLIWAPVAELPEVIAAPRRRAMNALRSLSPPRTYP